ncbi:hypothetical protein Q5530_08380 [Saccharothrix sp. BKS2]|uniref:hypothetical protein n=1 Tax=Saccharothrix sp. BKS2 TaxID=3064400 RepID=UPI0039ECCD9A
MSPAWLTAPGYQVLFDYADGVHRFKGGRANGNPQLGSLYIRELPSVPGAGSPAGAPRRTARSRTGSGPSRPLDRG